MALAARREDPVDIVIDAQLLAVGLLQAGEDVGRRIRALTVNGDDLVEEGDMTEDRALEKIGAVADAHEGADARPALAGLEVGGPERVAGDGFAHTAPSAATVPFSGLAGFQR